MIIPRGDNADTSIEIKEEKKELPKTDSEKSSTTVTTSITTTKTIIEEMTSTEFVEENKDVENTEVIDNSNEEDVDLTKIVATDAFNYSMHKGHIEFKTYEACSKAGEDIAIQEVVDIKYPRCVDVTSKANTVMGYYLVLYCYSGNCNKYKDLIDMSNY